MGGRFAKWGGRLANAVLIVLGLVLIVLLYSMVTRALAPRIDPIREAETGGLVGDIIQVEVRNGCGIAGLAATTTMFLRDHGFDVVEVGDYESFDVAESRVVDRVGDLASARKVAALLGIPEERVVQEIRPEYYLDASVIIGRDYESLRPFGN